MKTILEYLSNHLRDNAQPWFYLIFAGFLAFSLTIRYAYGFNPTFYHSPYRHLWGFLFYAFPYFFTVVLYTCFFSKPLIYNYLGFWILSGMILSVLYLNQYHSFYKLVSYRFDPNTHYFLGSLGFNLQSIFFYLLIPLLYGWWNLQINQTNFYGISTQNFHWQPYAWMLLLMLPLLVWASFRPDFLNAYPRYKPQIVEYYWQISPFYTVSAYELTYIIQFIALEIFFRGFMVLALSQYLGSGAVFPMVAVYCYLHFFKPMPETLGSIFGGYILGVIAFYSRTVLGGMMIHISIALLMELLAFWQMYYWRK